MTEKFVELNNEELAKINGGAGFISRLWYLYGYGKAATTHANIKYKVPNFTGH